MYACVLKKLYEDKTALTSVEMINGRIILWYSADGMPILRILTDRGIEYKGTIANHAYQLSLSIQDIVQLRHILRTLTLYVRDLMER